MTFRKKLVYTVALAAASAATTVVIYKLAGDGGGPLVDVKELTLGRREGDKFSFTTNILNWLTGTTVPTSTPSPPAPAGSQVPDRPAPAAATSDVPSPPLAPTPAAAPRTPEAPRVVARETTRTVHEAAPPPAPREPAPDITVIALGPQPHVPQVFNEQVQDHIALAASAEATVNATATLTTASATGVAVPLTATTAAGPATATGTDCGHRADAVADCGSVQNGCFVAPPGPHGELECTVADTVGDEVTRTTYHVPAVP